MKPILITSYINPDLDGVSCIVAYAEYLSHAGKDVVGMVMGQVQDEVEYVYGRFKWDSLPVVDNPDAYERVILVDVSFLEGLDGRIPLGNVIEIIDHHFANDDAFFPSAKLQIEKIGAAATMVCERFMNDTVQMSEKSALLLASAIIVQTNNLKASVTTERDEIAYRWLVGQSGQLEDFWKQYWRDLFQAKSDVTGGRLYKKIDSDLAKLKVGDILLGFAQLEILGVESVLAGRMGDIEEALHRVQEKEHTRSICLNLMELEDCSTVLVAFDPEMRKILEQTVGVKFEGNIARNSKNQLRKLIMPPVQEALEAGYEWGK